MSRRKLVRCFFHHVLVVRGPQALNLTQTLNPICFIRPDITVSGCFSLRSAVNGPSKGIDGSGVPGLGFRGMVRFKGSRASQGSRRVKRLRVHSRIHPEQFSF